MPLHNAFAVLAEHVSEGEGIVVSKQQPTDQTTQLVAALSDQPPVYTAATTVAQSVDTRINSDDELLESAIGVNRAVVAEALFYKQRLARIKQIWLRGNKRAVKRTMSDDAGASSSQSAQHSAGSQAAEHSARESAPSDPPTTRESIESDDRAIIASEFAVLQKLCNQSFTLDACCNPSGDNALCQNFCSTDNSFFDHEVTGHHVWLNPPFSDIYAFIDHYAVQKQTSPHNTSACILVPNWGHQLVHPALANMRVLKVYQKGYHLFTAPSVGEGTKRRRVNGLRWPVTVYYDPPTPVNTSNMAMLFQGSVHGQCAHILLDSGAQQMYVSRAYCEQRGISIDACTTVSVQMGDGSVVRSIGTALIRVHLQRYKALLRCHVVDLATSLDLVLGNDWMVTHQCHLHMAEQRVTLISGGRAITLTQPSVTKDDRAHTEQSQNDTVELLSHMQAKRILRKQQRHFLVMVRAADTDLLANATNDTSSNSEFTVDELAAQVADNPDGCKRENVIKLLQKHSGAFARSLDFLKLPPEREVSHSIPLIPGARPVFKPMFRYSPRELEAMKKEITKLLQQGLIEPSNSPWGAPLMLVPKKTPGQFRCVVDWRLLNSQTVRNAYPLPRVDDLFDKLHGITCMSSCDLLSGYFQIRISEEDRPKTAFRTPFGSYQFKVLGQGLTNAPAVFQQTINSVFRDKGLGDYVLIYLDDLLIISKTPEEHLQHIESVLQTLKDANLFACLEKCHFNQAEVEFLGHIVSAKGIAVDPKKVQVVKDWPRPTNTKELRSFLGLANYFRKFIQGYSKLVAPLTKLTQDGTNWKDPDIWSSACQDAFDAVKRCLTEAPVLAAPDFTKPFEVVCDASVSALGAVLLQEGRPVAFESKKLTSAEYNYSTTEQELLAVVHALTKWRCYLEGTHFTVVTDHCPNTFFSTKPLLSRRQARWSELLQQYDFTWVYRPGRNNVADPLSRMPHPDCNHVCFAALSGATCNSGYLGAVDTATPIATISSPLVQLVREGYKEDQWFADRSNLKHLSNMDGLWYKDKCLVIPNIAKLKDMVLKEAHDSVYAGHFGLHKTLKLVARQFWWPHLKQDIASYVAGCDACQRNKSAHIKPAGPLKPLPIPDGKWDVVSVDFVVQLPKTKSGYDAICVFVDKLTKMVHLCPTTTDIGAEGTAKLFMQNVWRLHGLPHTLISDRGTQFTSKLFSEVCAHLGVQQALSSAFHPQSDGQTERANRVMEEVLRHYVNPTQDDWDEYLPCVEFAINNSVHMGTQQTPFFLNYGVHPSTPLSRMTPALRSAVKAAAVPFAAKFTDDMHNAVAKAKQCLEAAQQRAKAYADTKRSPVSVKVGDQVLLSTKNIAIKHNGSAKLMPKWIGPFTIIKQVNEVAFKLELPSVLSRLHPVFHASLLKPYTEGGRVQPPPLPELSEDGELEYEVEQILGHRKSGRTMQYLIKWLGYGHEHNEYVPAKNLNCPELLQEYMQSPAYLRSKVKVTQKQQTKAVKQQAAQAARQQLPVVAQANAGLRRSPRNRKT